MKIRKGVIGAVAIFLASAIQSSAQILPPPPPGGGGGNTNYTPPFVNTNRNFVKFQQHNFTIIDTNYAAAVDMNLYSACTAFPNNTNTGPTLQVAQYGTNAVIIKATHFDYSAETRDFNLIVSDSPDRPIWKTNSFNGSSDGIDGWLVAGTVANWEVVDTMYLEVSNIGPGYNVFFHGIPYSGPQISLSGAQPYYVVSNTITLHATILDLSGVTNTQFSLDVDGVPARYTLSGIDTVTIQTPYNVNGLNNLNATAVNNACPFNPTNISDNAKLYFSGYASLPLDFENDTFLAFASDNCSPDIGTNYMQVVINQAQNVDVQIYDPSSGAVLEHLAGNVPYAATVSIPWNFTKADGVTPYTNDTYGVRFNAAYTPTMGWTNLINRSGVRPGAGCLLTYEWEDPSTTTGKYLNDRADQVIAKDLLFLYNDIYDQSGLTQYGAWQVGTNRNFAVCRARVPSSPGGWLGILSSFTNIFYSELTIAQCHGSAGALGGGHYLTDVFDPSDLINYVQRPTTNKKNWRLRKATIFACWSGDIGPITTYSGSRPTWAEACGIQSIGVASTSYGPKNCGLFFAGKLPQGPYGAAGDLVSADVAEFLDLTFVCGPNPYPGGCDPTYSFRYAVQRMVNSFPNVTNGIPAGFGFQQCVYTDIYDNELSNLNISHVKLP